MDAVVEEPQVGGHPPVLPPTVQTLNPAQSDAAEFAAAAERAFNDQPAQETALDGISGELLAEFELARQLRIPTEERWLKDLRQFRGIYEPEVLETLANRSQSFVRRTRVKVVTTDSRMMDYLFPAGQEKNWTCDPTPKPSVSDEAKQAWGQALAQKLGRTPTQQELDDEVMRQCTLAAKGMSTLISDQLTEIRYKQIVRKTLHSGNLFGTGIIKGPLVEKKTRQRFTHEGGKWTPKSEDYIVPFVDHVPLWRFYPDMAGAVDLEQSRFTYEEHRFTRHQMASLIGRTTFKGGLIKDYLEANPRGASKPRSFELQLHALGEREGVNVQDSGMYDLLERWGWLTGEQLCNCGIEVPDDRKHESFFTNVWMLPNGQIIKAVMQPINGVTWPYHFYYFDKDETSIFGEGLASIMRDDQDMLNAATRMMLDNGALTSGPMLEIALDQLASTERADEVFPWKIWYRKNASDLSRPAIRQIQLENNIEWLSKMAAMFEQNSDEVTAIPRYMSGENATTGAAGTASGMSMLMGAANIVIKELLNSWDEGVTRGFIQALYRWNMQFSSDDSIKGDFDVKARGTASLIAKEVRNQQLNEFAQGPAANPMYAPFIKQHKLLMEIADAAEMSTVVKTEDEVAQEQQSDQAKQMQQMQQRLQEAQIKEQEAKAAKLVAEAQVATTKVQEMLKNIDQIVANTVDKRVQTIFAALQAGGVATRDPMIAPAGDEILRSAGFRDLTPDPTIAELDGPPVQPQPVTQRLMGKGETFAQDPRLSGPGTQAAAAGAGASQAQDPAQGDPSAMTPGESDPGATSPQAASTPVTAQPAVATGHVGERAGIETTRMDHQ